MRTKNRTQDEAPPQATQTPLYLSMAQVAERYGVHYKLVNALVNDGTLPSIRLSRNAVRISVADLEAWEQAQLTRGGK